MTSVLEPLRHRPPGSLLEQYLGIWAIEETAFMQLWHHVQGLDLQSHMQAATQKTEATAKRAGSIAQIEIRGTMTKFGSSLSDAGSTIRLREAIRAAARDSAVDGILLIWDTPGGSAAGTKELGDDIAAAAQAKPLVSFVEDMAASAGYWGASQATKVFANSSSAIVGSVGTFIGLYDLSGAAAQQGIKPVVIKTGELKAAGFPGTEISAEQKAMWQGLADAIQTEFTAAVKKARGLSKEQLQTVLTARSFSASEAMSLGLIDGIKTQDQAVAELRRMIGSKRKESRMDAEQAAAPLVVGKPVLSAEQLMAACPGASSEWYLNQLKAGATIETATKCYADQLRLEIKTRDEKLDLQASEIGTLKTQLAAKTNGTGQHGAQTEKVNGQTETSGGSAIERWEQALAVKTGGGKTKQQAIAALIREQPELHKAYLAEFNATRPVSK